jgi:SAM-dependent methyltransferase
MGNDYQSFYDLHHSKGGYAGCTNPCAHSEFENLNEFLKRYSLHDKRCLEIGCAKGAFQNMVTDYTGIDITQSLAEFIYPPKRFICASATALPFMNEEFYAIWSIHCLEHVHDLSTALAECRRVLRPGGYLFLRPAWNVPKWVSTGISVRNCSELPLKLKFAKLFLPIWNHRLIKAPLRLLQRTKWVLKWTYSSKPCQLFYKKLTPNYEVFWTSDSDACNNIDLFAMACYFKDCGDQCLSPHFPLQAFFSSSVPLIIRKEK